MKAARPGAHRGHRCACRLRHGRSRRSSAAPTLRRRTRPASHRRASAAGLDIYRHLIRLVELGPEQEFLLVPSDRANPPCTWRRRRRGRRWRRPDPKLSPWPRPAPGRAPRGPAPLRARAPRRTALQGRGLRRRHRRRRARRRARPGRRRARAGPRRQADGERGPDPAHLDGRCEPRPPRGDHRITRRAPAPPRRMEAAPARGGRGRPLRRGLVRLRGVAAPP